MSIAARSVLRESISDAAPAAQAAPSDDQDFWREKVQKLEKEAKERHRSARAYWLTGEWAVGLCKPTHKPTFSA